MRTTITKTMSSNQALFDRRIFWTYCVILCLPGGGSSSSSSCDAAAFHQSSPFTSHRRRRRAIVVPNELSQACSGYLKLPAVCMYLTEEDIEIITNTNALLDDETSESKPATTSIPLPHFVDEESLFSFNGKLDSLLRNNINSTPYSTKPDYFYSVSIEKQPEFEETSILRTEGNFVLRNGATQKESSNRKTEVINIIEQSNEVPVVKPETSSSEPVTLSSLWRRRRARSAEEGIRREKTKLSDVLDKARGSMMELQQRKVNASRKFAARTITGFINALAEDVDGLEVQVTANPATPLWKKQVDDITIQFSKLGFKPLRISGGVVEPSQKAHHYQARSMLGIYDDFVADRKKRIGVKDPRSSKTEASSVTDSSSEAKVGDANEDDELAMYDDQSYSSPTADEAFDRIDVDNSGSLDRDELIQALNLAASASFEDLDDQNKVIIENLASDLVELYDFNGDGVVDRKEYKSMVADMAELRQKQIKRQYQADQEQRKQQLGQDEEKTQNPAFNLNNPASWIPGAWNWIDKKRESFAFGVSANEINATAKPSFLEARPKGTVEVLDSPALIDSMAKTLGSITFSDMKLDLRQLLFGAVPVIKHITPGGPLVLEPFTVTVNGSFKREDIMNSFLLDAALRRLVARVLRRRIGFFRDFLEGAVFYGRSWKMFSESGPKVEVPELTEIEFDKDNKLIITGRARVKTGPKSPVVDQAFKVRTRIGTRQNGRFVRLEEPELALVLECPKSWERNLNMASDALNIKRPARPKPLYSFFPIYSPFKLNDDSGFDLGEDNTINSLYIYNGALCFEMSSVLRPGRFLGSHYLAFSIPNRTFIVTLDRVRDGIRAARKTKKAARTLLKQSLDRRTARRRRRQIRLDEDASGGKAQVLKPPKVRGFFGRFVDGYLQAEREEAKKERITTAIRDFFGRQGTDF